VVEERLNQAMEDIFSTPIAQRDLKTIDLLCRALHLGDVLTNRGNFGRVIDTTTGEEVGWRVVDFAIEGCAELQQKPASYDAPRIAAEFRAVGGRLYYGGFYPLRNALLKGEGAGVTAKVQLLQNCDIMALFRMVRKEVLSLFEDKVVELRIGEELHVRKMKDLLVYLLDAVENVTTA